MSQTPPLDGSAGGISLPVLAGSPPALDPVGRAGWVGPPQPTTLLAWWEGEAAPEPAAVATRLAEVLGGLDATRRIAPPSPGMRWASVVERGTRPPILLWLEDAQPLDPQEVARGLAPDLAAIPWVVGAQTLLDADDPRASYASLLSAVGDPARTVALLDPDTGRWSEADLLQRVLQEPLHLGEDHLWSTRAVRRSPDGAVWLFTEGLRRCGRPELELLEVPEPLAPAAAALLDALAPLLIEGAPPPATRWPVGPEHAVSLQPLVEATGHLDAASPGSAEDRERLFGAGTDPRSVQDRAAVCGVEPRGAYRRIWEPPRELLEAIAAGEVALYQARTCGERLRRLARGTVDAWCAWLRSEPRGVVVRFALDGGESGPQWHRLREVLDRAVLATPQAGAGEPVVGGGEMLEHRLDLLRTSLVGWEALFEGRIHGPGELAPLRAAVEASPGPDR